MQIEDVMPVVGAKAPAITAAAHSGETVSLSGLLGQWVVLYFYPKDATPGCTTEAREFRDANSDFASENTVILGVSPDDAASHCRFVKKEGLNFLLLCDPEQSAARAYGVWVEKNLYGRKYMGVQRATFLINPEGETAHVWPKVKAQGHAQLVLAALRAAKAQAS